MPGPYDLSDTERSRAARMPFGLGSDGLVSIWPDLLLGGGGFMMRRGAMSMITGRGFEFIASKRTRDLERGLGRILAHGGETALEKAMRGVAGHGAFRAEIRAAAKASAASGIDMKWAKILGKNAPRLTRDPAMLEGVIAKLGGRTKFASKLFATSRAMTGVFHGITGAVAGAYAMDIFRSFGEAVVDWRPRASKPYPYEFGNVFYDPRGAYTQRQRVLMAIHDSQLSTRAALGNEASFLHS